MQSLWMLFASFVFAIMGVCVKLASDFYSTSEIVMYRGIIGATFMFSMTRLQGGTLRTAFPLQHAWRCAIGVTALWLWFYAIGEMPLAPAMTLNYMSPIWIAAILFIGGWWRGKNRFEWGMAAAVATSFVGVTMLLQPSFQTDQWFSGIIALLSGMLAALAYLQVKQLGQLGEPESRVVFYFSCAGLIAGLAGTLLGPQISSTTTIWHAHTPKGIVLILGIGVSATVAQVAMTRAYRLGKTLVTANLQYTGIVFSSFWGIALWNDTLGSLGWAGIAVILVSGIAATFYNTRKVQFPARDTADAIANEI
ncbi:MAG TPA: DMT family transporter [Burkholderiaceae bacterium]|nr:DMT family transporter [Burkholderiaceae bacterium]